MGDFTVAIVSTFAPPSARPQGATAGVAVGQVPWPLGLEGAAVLLAVGVVAWLESPFTPLAALVVSASWAVVLRLTGTRAGFLAGRPAGVPLQAAALLGLGHWLASIVVPLPLTAAQVLVFAVTAATTSAALRYASSAAVTRSGQGRQIRTLVLGNADDGVNLQERSDGRLLVIATCGPDQLGAVAKELAPDVVVAFPGAGLEGRVLQRVAWQLEDAGIALVVSTRLSDVAPRRLRAARLGAVDLVEVLPCRRRGGAAVAKLLWERAAAVGVIVLLAPILVALALAVRLDSRGPVIFRQTRVGRNGKPFTMWKFRTMHVDADHLVHGAASESNAILFKLRADPRVTRVGRFLRRYSLDELPQLVNVVLGQMSLVGPRPALPVEVSAYDQDPRRRLAVKPGLTGLWQVSGRSDLSWEESVRLDLDYVDNWSLGRDLGIIARTVQAVLGHRGAY